MAKVSVPFSEWRPDVATLDTEYATTVNNVFPGPNSYRPFQGHAAITTVSLSSGGNDTYTKIFLRMEGASSGTTFTDTAAGAASSHTWTAAGNAVTDTAQQKFGASSLFCDGTGDWITSNDSTDFTMGSSSTTIETFIHPSAAGLLYISGQGNASSSAANTSFLVRRASSGVVEALFSNGSSFTTIATTTSVASSVWSHIAVCLDRSYSASNLAIYLNGTREATGTFNGNIPDSSNAYRIGAGGELTTTPWNGHIDEYRHDIGIARYSSSGTMVSSFTVPTAPYFQGGSAVGLALARTSSGSFKIYAGTTTKFFSWSATGWSDVTRASGGNYNVQSGHLWRSVQFGQYLYTTNVSDTLQRIEVNTGTAYAAVTGSPPQAKNVAVIGPFLVLSGLSTNSRLIQWSALEDPTGWTVGTNLSDQQEMPDGGPVQGVAGGEGLGYVVQDRAIRTMQWLPGDTTTIFSFSKVSEDVGSVSPYGFISLNNVLYCLDYGGFYALSGNQLFPIGHEKIDTWFFDNSDPARLNQVLAFKFVKHMEIGWAFYSQASSTTYDKIIIYDIPTQRWSLATISAKIWAQLASTGIDLDTSTGEPDDALLDSSAASLDSSAYIGGLPSTGAIDENGLLSFLSGPNLEAKLETSERHLVPGMRAFINEVYPLDDASDTGTIAVGSRERLQNTLSWGAAAPLEVTGTASVLSSARLHRFRRTIPAMATWTHAQGVVVDAQQDGNA